MKSGLHVLVYPLKLMTVHHRVLFHYFLLLYYFFIYLLLVLLYYIITRSWSASGTTGTRCGTASPGGHSASCPSTSSGPRTRTKFVLFASKIMLKGTNSEFFLATMVSDFFFFFFFFKIFFFLIEPCNHGEWFILWSFF